MKESESPTSGTFDEQLRAMERGQRMLTRSTMRPVQQAAQAQWNLGKLMLRGLELNESLQQTGTEVTREAFQNYLDSFENAAKDVTEEMEREFRETADRQQSAAQQFQHASDAVTDRLAGSGPESGTSIQRGPPAQSGAGTSTPRQQRTSMGGHSGMGPETGQAVAGQPMNQQSLAQGFDQPGGQPPQQQSMQAPPQQQQMGQPPQQSMGQPPQQSMGQPSQQSIQQGPPQQPSGMQQGPPPQQRQPMGSQGGQVPPQQQLQGTAPMASHHQQSGAEHGMPSIGEMQQGQPRQQAFGAPSGQQAGAQPPGQQAGAQPPTGQSNLQSPQMSEGGVQEPPMGGSGSSAQRIRIEDEEPATTDPDVESGR